MCENHLFILTRKKETSIILLVALQLEEIYGRKKHWI